MLQIGLPDDLRKKVKLSPLPSPDSELFYEDPFFCWDMRRTKMGGRICLVAMNVSTSLVGVFGNLDPGYLTRIDSLGSACAYNAVRMHFGEDIADSYLDGAQPLILTKTHGRKATGNLNQIALALECMGMDPELGFQFEAARRLNEDAISKGAAFDNGYDMRAVERFEEKLMEFGLLGCRRREQGNIIDFKAVQLWAQLPDDIKDMLLHNAFCVNCGSAAFAPGYSLRADRYGLMIEGTCAKCGGHIVRCVD